MFSRWPLRSSEAFSFAVLTTLAVLASPSSATDIEGLFEKQNDLSGTYYEFKGKQLVGTQAMTDNKERGIEILEAPEDVVARNPDLFK